LLVISRVAQILYYVVEIAQTIVQTESTNCWENNV